MAGLFGGKKGSGQTVLILDIENGSVGSALAHLAHEHSPKLFGEVRVAVPLLHARDAKTLSSYIHKAATDALVHAQEVAARLRAHPGLARLGNPTRAHVFLHAPWSRVEFAESGAPAIAAPEDFLASMRGVSAGTVGDLPLYFHSFGTAAAPILPSLYETYGPVLVCVVSGELVELLIVEGGAVRGYGTIPFGTHTLLRTLRTHGGISEAEARSLLKLPVSSAEEALQASVAHFAHEVSDTARTLLASESAGTVLVVAHEPFSTWFARALTHEAVGALFAEGSTVRTVRPAHVMPYIAAHAQRPDIALMLGSLFADARLSGIQ